MPDHVSIPAGTPESRDMYVKIQRGIRLTERLNATPYEDADAIRAAWSELTGQPVDPTFSLIPPIHVQHGLNTRLGRNVFINQGCTLMDIGGIDIGDDVMIGPNVSLITAGHPLEPSLRRTGITAAPISVERNVWIGAGAIVLQGVTVGEDAVVGAGAVISRDVPPATLVAGAPARIVRRLDER
ncbi:MAG: hexapeptide repeat-containing transferase [Acidimicrobiales bacterium]|nr:hexapeptide repeat-containing transferase [Acidimicrobiales bacterium]